MKNEQLSVPTAETSAVIPGIPLQTGEQLLKQKAFTEAIKVLKEVVSAVDEDFTKYYAATLQCFAAFTQTMPNNKDEKTLLFSHQMAIVLAALKLAQGRLLPQVASVEDKNRRAPSWMFGIFAAGLLRGIERIQHDRLIELRDSRGEIKNYWSPLWCPALTGYSRYQVVWPVASDNKNTQPPTINIPISAAACRSLLVPMVIPRVALDWLQADPELNMQWWDCLCNQVTPNNELALLLQEAEAALGIVKPPVKATDKNKTGKSPRHAKKQATGNNSANVPPVIPPVVVTQVPISQQFTDWLTEQIAIAEMQPFIFRVELGLFVMREAIDKFIPLKKLTEENLIDALTSENKIVKYKEKIFQRYTSNNWVNTETFEGVVLNLNGLSPSLSQLPILTDRQPDII